MTEQFLSQDDARYLLGFLSIIITFTVSWLKVISWPDYYKFALAAGLSILAGFLTAYATGQLSSEGTIVYNASIVLSVSQFIYYGAFRGLGLEKFLFPKQAVLSEAHQSLSEKVDTMSTATAKEILDPGNTTTLTVSTKVNEGTSVK